VKTTRKLIIEHLKTRRTASATEIGHAIRVTPANIRHHLEVLMDEGVVQIAGERPSDGRGRPTHLYSLVEQVKGHNLDGLASALLQESLETLPEEERKMTLERVANRLIEYSIPSVGGLTQRLYSAIRQLNNLNYQARWEAHADAPRLQLGHCPYAAILPGHPELCQMDGKLLERLLNAPVLQTAKLSRNSRGEAYCSFKILLSTARDLPVKK
jgi:predicted ArsR family transcriptional regulator